MMYASREELIDEGQYQNMRHGEVYECPHIEIKIGKGQRMELGLIDTGSQVSCIRQETYEALIQDGERFEESRVTNVNLITAVGGKSKRITKQVLVPITFGNVKTEVSCLVVPKLVKAFIFGADWCIDNGINMKFIKNGEKYRLNMTLEGGENVFIVTPGNEINEIEDTDTKEYVSMTSANVINIIMNSEMECCSQGTGKVEREESLGNRFNRKDLNAEQENILENILTEFREVFSEIPGKTHVYCHKLNVTDDSPFSGRAYPVPHIHRPAVQKALDEMMAMGIIKKSINMHVNPLIVVAKKDGTVRLCLDAREINKRINPEYERPEKIQELIRKFYGKPFMSSLDLTSGFWQVPLAEEDQKFTGFGFEGIGYIFTRVPFGLKTSGSGFIRALNIALGNQVKEFTVVYIDDLVIFSASFEDHMEHIRIILRKLLEAGFTVKMRKSVFCREQITFLGHIVSGTGVKPDPDRIVAIQNFPAPKSQKQLRSFLGLCNFFRQFVPKYAMIMDDMRELLGGKMKWRWTEKAAKAFEELKAAFQRQVILSQPNLNQKFLIECDASYVGVGAVLYQEEHGERKVISLASRGLNKAERNYTVTEIELLAVVFGLTKFREYVLGREITIVSDHKALQFLLTSKMTSNRLTRWILYIQEYNFEIKYRKGSENIIADYLSRHPTADGKEVHDERIKGILCGVHKVLIDEEITKRIKGLKKLQKQSTEGQEILNKMQSQDAGNKRGNYEILDEYICRIDSLGEGKVWIPSELTEDIIIAYHLSLGHYGAEKCYAAIKEKFWWKGMARSIRVCLSRCDRCQRTKHPSKYLEGPWQNVERKEKGELVLCDYYGPLVKAKYGYMYVFVIIDCFTKYVKLYPMRRATTKTTLKLFLEKYCVEFGKPKEILSDNGSQFTSKMWIDTLKGEGIRPIFCSIRNPQGNMAERVMRRLGQVFRIYCNKKNWQWYEWLEDTEKWINNVTHSSTGFQPIRLQTGKYPEDSIAKMLKIRIKPREQNLQHELVIARENIRKAANKRGKQQKKIFYGKFEEGTKVLLRVPKVSSLEKREMSKIFDLFEGPYVVAKEINQNVYLLRALDGKEKGKFNVRSLKEYKEKPLN